MKITNKDRENAWKEEKEQEKERVRESENEGRKERSVWTREGSKEREDFWARALHLLACSGTRHIHPLRCRGRSVPLRQRRFPPHTAVSLWRYLLVLPRPSPPPPPPPILPTSLFPLATPTPRPTTRHTRSISPRSAVPLLLPRESPPVLPSRVPRFRDRDARESIARGLR